MLQTSDVGEARMATTGSRSMRTEFVVMSVDSDKRLLDSVQRAVADSGLPLKLAGSATSAPEAIDVSSRLQPDIVVLDIAMPSQGGAVLGRQLQGLLDREPLLICLTADQSFEKARLAVQLGAVDLLLKPVKRAELLKALQKAMATLRSIRTHEQERLALERKLGQPVQASPAAVRHGRSRSFQIAQAVRRYVDVHYAEDVSLQSAADYVRLSASYLGPLFKAVCGVSFRTYLRLVRVAEAKDLMRDPTLNLSEIAQRVGFEDENYFSQVFLEVTGTRPGQYRNSRMAQQ